MSGSFQSKSDFLKLSFEVACPDGIDEMLSSALEALPGLWFHCDDQFVDRAMEVAMTWSVN